ncbi:M23 family metallopeptidase [Paenibacillus flagellatus]|uniref:Metalloendopeptidase n=1 Tax=Paenibacillus flagellatus TaxID=2211139 RepID=A0A2V5KXP6_9BACL|nr:M23 family metallopeptidase [Paenibacillus flagellatus]PYI57257.1 metalloendopeptidase [Paenibacillus flagellatus]
MRKTILALIALTVMLTGCGSGGTGETGSAGTPPHGGAEHAGNAGAENKKPSEPMQADRLKPEAVGQALLDGEIERVYRQLSADFQKHVTGDQFREAVTTAAKGVSAWKTVSSLPLNGSLYLAQMSQDGKTGLKLATDANDTIASMQFVPLQSFPKTDSTLTKLAYRLPFQGDWYVFWGGENVLANYHYAVESQRYAYDFVQVKDGYSYKGDPSKNESYYAYGQKVVSPQDGTVVHVVNDIADNVPVGAMNAEQPAGNVVVIDHGNGEFSFLAHLKTGSATVKVGDSVTKGQVVGLCGNSGNSSEPHLHVQVSDSSDLFAGKAIRVRWEGGVNPQQGETVSAGVGNGGAGTSK